MDTNRLAIIIDLAESLISVARSNPSDLTAILRLAESIKAVVNMPVAPAA